MTKPKIAVVIPLYNHAEYIAEAIESVFSQELLPTELVVIDDGSSDQSAAKAKEALSKAPRKLKTQLISRENRGAPATINQGVLATEAEWIAILNSDDVYTPDRFAKMFAKQRQSKSHFLYSGLEHIDVNGERQNDRHPFRFPYLVELHREVPANSYHFLNWNVALTTSNFLFDRELCRSLGGFRNYVFIHDFDFVLRAISLTEPEYIEPELVRYRVHDSNTIRNMGFSGNIEMFKAGADLLDDLALNPVVKNPHAPWNPKQRNVFEKFLQQNPKPLQVGWIRVLEMMKILEVRD